MTKEEKYSMLNKAVGSLNLAFKCDPKTIERLVENRIACSPELMEHPFVQVEEQHIFGNTHYIVGMLGIINAVEPMTGSKIAGMFTEPNNCGFCRLLGFTIYKP